MRHSRTGVAPGVLPDLFGDPYGTLEERVSALA